MTYLDKYYKQLEGATILEYVGTVDYGSRKLNETPEFMVKLSSGEILPISIASASDTFEGGFIIGLPIAK